MSADASEFRDGLVELVKRMYVVILGLGFSFIIRDLLLADYGPVVAAAKLLYFLGLYYFLSYDWMAYTVLVDAYPYSVGERAGLAPQGRFYADLTHLLIKAGLIFLALQTLDAVTLAGASLLFAGWHVTIVLWHLFAHLEYDTYDVTWRSHSRMIGLYLALAAGMLALADAAASPSGRLLLVLLLMLVVVLYATSRKRTLIAQLTRASEPDCGADAG